MNSLEKVPPYGGGILEKRYDAHPPSWLVVSAGQQKRFQKLGVYFEDKSSDFGSTSNRGCLISFLYHSLCIVCMYMYLHAIVTLISRHCLLGSSLPLPSAMVAQSVSAKLGLGQISSPFYDVNVWLIDYL